MTKFKPFLKQRLKALDEIESIYFDIDDPHSIVQWIVEQTAEIAAQLGRLDLVESVPKTITVLSARAYLYSCLKMPAQRLGICDLTVKQAAERLSVSTRTIYDLVESGRLRAQRIGIGRGTIRIRPADLERILSKSVKSVKSVKSIYKHLTI